MSHPAASPRRVVVTGASGFVGRHVCLALGERGDEVRPVTRATSGPELDAALRDADAVIHLAGVNRPDSDDEFATGNTAATRALGERLVALGNPAPVVFSSSTQAELDNAYGRSKRDAERELAAYAARAGAAVTIFRLTNVFGPRGRPNYNSFVSTLCHGVATGSPYTVADRSRVLRLVYVDDVAVALLAAADEAMAGAPAGSDAVRTAEAGPVHEISVGELVDRVEAFGAHRSTLLLPDLSDALTRKLYATYLSYLEPAAFTYPLQLRTDARGGLAEFVKSPSAGQIFISRTLPGIERGNHYHHTKTEKFLVVEGEAVIRFRRTDSGEVVEHRVSGRDFRVADIPPGWTHSIENVGEGEMVVVFWASEIFDPAQPDTHFLPVRQGPA